MYIKNGKLVICYKDTPIFDYNKTVFPSVSEKMRKPKKISGHSLVDLVGMNIYKKRGDVMLELLRLIKPEPIDPFYTNRGAIAENIVKDTAIQKGFNVETFNPKDINYDNFSHIDNFGGLIDLRINGETVEVKSKSIGKYDDIRANGVLVEETQGEYYSCLNNEPTCLLKWVFFTPEQETEIRDTGKLTNYNGIKILTKKIEVNKDKIRELMRQALTYYKSVLASQSIAIEDISDTYLKKLKEMYGAWEWV